MVNQKNIEKYILSIILTFSAAYLFAEQPKFELKVLQMNIWQEGTMVPGGFEAIGNEIIDKDPDIVLFSEIRNYNKIDFIQRIREYLAFKGNTYYGESSGESLDVGLISKYPIQTQAPNPEEGHNTGSVLKTKLSIQGQRFIFYSAHLDYTNYACYLPRGYDGVTWKKMSHPIVDHEVVLAANKRSKRDEAIRDVLVDMEKEDKGQIIILGGDFNEPSHLDWTVATKDLFDHGGAVIPWHCSVMLQEGGLMDSFREFYPNPLTHPGFTYPAYNKDVDIGKLAWAPDADDRDRIDYLYYLPHKRLQLKDIRIVGPIETVVRAKMQIKDSEDRFILPKAVWPTDHKALLATFVVYK
ncbi:endonuclease/exonuclease/phosphatase family protein [Sphingobacterium sp. SYP-B4668]|uniref:endonuclease/exonuclease/phosphatase family protein n=1 Tax=Sphingobacterium sp. SYP-B4668 TaxID=2996035 RepID=UPI0022DDBB45|nr:endonuclease/exonuclease/phosphatase family protein [Sphingobacterium sp. SYP-B4668]